MVKDHFKTKTSLSVRPLSTTFSGEGNGKKDHITSLSLTFFSFLLVLNFLILVCIFSNVPLQMDHSFKTSSTCLGLPGGRSGGGYLWVRGVEGGVCYFCGRLFYGGWIKGGVI